MFGPGLFSGVKVETGALAHLPVGQFVRHVIAARAGVRADDDEPEFGGHAAIFAFFHDVGMGAGEAGKIPQDGAGLMDRLRRHVNRKGHLTFQGFRCVRKYALHAAKGRILRNDVHEDIPCEKIRLSPQARPRY
ncbi:hypothetical protein D3C86_1758890 [compost metagenome]